MNSINMKDMLTFIISSENTMKQIFYNYVSGQNG